MSAGTNAVDDALERMLRALKAERGKLDGEEYLELLVGLSQEVRDEAYELKGQRRATS
jgi:hypothetical protein